MDEPVVLAIEDGVATITLNRPEVGNALNVALLLELKESVLRLGADESVAAVIVTGAGRMFCTGEDLRGLANPQVAAEQLSLTLEDFAMLRELPQPTIAAVNGYAVTGGLELLLACDLRIASDQAMFGDTHARVGIMPGAGDSQRLPRLIGLTRAKEMLFTCDFMSAEEAFRVGLVNRVVPAGRLLDEAREMAGKIAANDTTIVRRLKKLVNEGWERDLGAGLMLEQIEYHKSLLEHRWKDKLKHRGSMQERNRASARR